MEIRSLAGAFILAVLMLTGFSLPLVAQQPPEPDLAAEYAVYSVVLDSLHVLDTPDEVLVVNDSAGLHPEGVLLAWPEHEIFPAVLSPELIRRFKAANQHSLSLENRFDVRIPIKLLDRAGREEFFGPTLKWDQFFERYPGAHALIEFSRVGFTSDMQQALVYAEFICGGRCGWGQLIRLTRQQESWVIQQTERVVTF